MSDRDESRPDSSELRPEPTPEAVAGAQAAPEIIPAAEVAPAAIPEGEGDVTSPSPQLSEAARPSEAVQSAEVAQSSEAVQSAEAVKPTKPPKAPKPQKAQKTPKPPKQAKPAKASKERTIAGADTAAGTGVGVGTGAARASAAPAGASVGTTVRAPGRRSAARTGLRIATSVVVLALGAATVGAAAVLSLPSVAAGVPSVVVTPVASDQTRVCPGPYLGQPDTASAPAAGSDGPSLVSLGTPTLITGIVPSSDTMTTSTLTTPDATAGSAAPTELTAPGSSGTLLGGSQSQQVTLPDVAGLASSECAEASADSWIAAGSTVTGRTSYIVLSNPTDVVSTVTLSIYDESGVVNAPGTSGITVQPHSQRALSLAGFAPNVVSPVIHVQASGGTVLASLQQSVIRGLTPGGIDVAGPTGAPALQQTIAGVQIVSTSAIAEQAADPASSDLPAALRVYVPGAAGATITVTMKSETLGVADTVANYSATGGVVTDFPFPSVTDDTYSVVVTSDQPVVVGARSAVVSGGTDFAWYQSGPPVNGTFLFVTATGPSPRLQLVNTGTEDAAVTITPSNDSTAAPATLTVPANGAAGLLVGANTPYTVVTSEPLTASVGYLGDGLISAFNVSPASPLAAPITVYGG